MERAGGEGRMKRKPADLLKRLGPPKTWLISVEDIEREITAGPCRHLIPQVGDCKECCVEMLLRRQMASLAQRLGCSADDAESVSDSLVSQFLEKPRQKPRQEPLR